MDLPDPADLHTANEEMKRLVGTLLDGLDQQRADLSGVAERLSTSRSSAWSADRLVEVTVDAYGIVVDVRLASNACQVCTAERLAQSMTEAARSAAVAAQQRRADIVAPITETADGLPDLPDLFRGAPSLRDIREIVTAATRTDDEHARDDRDAEREQ